jgi:ketosteroid isomerase-like protein
VYGRERSEAKHADARLRAKGEAMSASTQQRAEANLATVGQIYEAFGRGDVPAILALIAEDCAWESWLANSAQAAGISYLQPRRGPAGVAEFFAAVGQFEIDRFEVLDMFAGGEKVAVEVLIEARAPGGGRFSDEELHLYTLDESGKVTRMRHYVDTAKHIAADRGEDTVGA